MPLIQTFSLANIKQFQYIHATQQQVAQFFVDLNTEKNERLKLYTTIRRLEDELIKLRRQINEPSPSSLPVPFTVNPPCSAAFQDTCALSNAQISKPSITITLKRASSITFKPQLSDQQRGPPTQSTSGTLSSDIESRVKQMEEEITKAKNCRETILSIYRSQFNFLYDKFQALESGGSDTILTILWKIFALRLVFDTAKSASRFDNAATNPSTHYNSPVYPNTPSWLYLLCPVLSTWSRLCCRKSRFNYVCLIPRRLRWFIGMAVP